MDAHEKLIRRIVPTLTRELGKLLEYLYGKMPAKIPAKEILREHYGRDPLGEDPVRARERVKSLREGLEAYRDQTKGERWVCELKTDSGTAGGYFLEFTRSSGSSCREAFWETHLDAESDVAIIKDPLLFYYRHATGKVFRYVNTNIDEPDHDLAMKELERLHKSDYSSDLMPGHFYVDIGQVRAADRLSQYFEREMNRRTRLLMKTDIQNREILSSSSVLLGTIRTNSFIRRFFRSSDSLNLTFRLDPENFTEVQIRNPTEAERKKLAPLGLKVDDAGIGHLRTASAELTLGVVTRVPNPGGDSSITMICSDATYNTAELLDTLTNEKLLSDVFGKVGWSKDTLLPPVFEWLFLAQMWPGNQNDATKKAELLAWRAG